MFVHLNPEPALPRELAFLPEEVDVYIRERREGLRQLLQTVPAKVVNRPDAGHSNSSKPFQMAILSQIGLEPPPWIASNDADVVAEFAAKCPYGAIYKSCSGLRSQVRRIDDVVMAHLRSGTAPIIVQAYVPGREVRVHVVGNRIFPTEVFAHEVDYRFQANSASFAATTVPDEIASRCIDMAYADNLVLAGFDFRISEDGRWYCLEMNPVPSFLSYEMVTGQPIGAAVLDVMQAVSISA